MNIIKILPALFFILAAHASNISAQDPKTTARDSNFSAQDSTLSYLALGDSYTIGESVNENHRWPVQLADTLKKHGLSVADPKIIAKTGWTTIELQEAIAKAELKPPYDLVSLLIGVNDQYDGLNFKEYPGRFEELLNKSIELAGGKSGHVLVVSIPDYSVTPFGQENEPEKIMRELIEYNAANEVFAKRLGVHYVNITLASQNALDDSALVANDGLHPSAKMYSQWVDQIVPMLLPEIQTWQAVSR
jgi:lysophospholipase L1-like esterase